MSAKAPATYDVWLVEPNKVYRAVPVAVVRDWVAQGRLLETDRARPAGAADWQRVGDLGALKVFIPPPEPAQPEDAAAALEPVEGAFRWKPRAEDDDDDVDMIPLIDVSLVLLIFFMITASVAAGAAGAAGMPAAAHGDVTSRPSKVWVSVFAVEEGRGRDRTRVHRYAVGVDDQAAAEGDDRLATEAEAVQRLKRLLPATGPPVDLTIYAQEDVPAGLVRQLNVKLEARDVRDRISKKYIAVSGAAP